MPRTQIEKLWLGGAAIAALLIAVVGYFFLVSPQRARTSSVEDQVSSAQLQTVSLQARITSLTSEQKKASSFRAALAQARGALPTLDDLSATPALLKSLQAIAHQSSTSVSSLTVGDPAAVIATPAVADATTPTATPSTSASSSVGAPAVAPAPSLYSVAVTASVSGTTKGLIGFLDRLQHHQPRAVLVSAVTMNGGSTVGQKPGGETMSLTMTAFVRPSSTAPVASTGTPTSGTVATPTSTNTP